MRSFKRSVHGLLTPPIAIAVACLGTPALATSDGPDRFAVRDVRADDTLALRAQPNPGARRITGLPPNTRGIENLGCVNGKTRREVGDIGPAGNQVWCKVRIGSLAGWASARFLREDTEILRPYSVSGAPTGPGQLITTSTAIEKKQVDEGRWKVLTQSVVSGSTTTDVPNEVIISAQLVDCRPGRSEVIRVGGDDSGYAVRIEDKQDTRFTRALSDLDEYNLWWLACRGVLRRYK